jgi:hypothetical protein
MRGKRRQIVRKPLEIPAALAFCPFRVFSYNPPPRGNRPAHSNHSSDDREVDTMRKVTRFSLAGLALLAACATVAPLSSAVAQQSDKQATERTAARATVVLAEPVGVVEWVPVRSVASQGIAEGAACGEATRHWQIVVGIGGLADGTGLTAVYLGRVPVQRGSLNRGVRNVAATTAAATTAPANPTAVRQGGSNRLMFSLGIGDVVRNATPNVTKSPVQQAAWLEDQSCPDCIKRPDCKSCPECEHHQPLPTHLESDILQIRRHLGLGPFSGTALENEPAWLAPHAGHPGDECQQCNESSFVEALRSIAVEAVPTIGLIRRFERMLDRNGAGSPQATPLELVDIPSRHEHGEQRREFEFELHVGGPASHGHGPHDPAASSTCPSSESHHAIGHSYVPSSGATPAINADAWLPAPVAYPAHGHICPNYPAPCNHEVRRSPEYRPGVPLVDEGRPMYPAPVSRNPHGEYSDPVRMSVYPVTSAQRESHSDMCNHAEVCEHRVNVREPEPNHRPQDHERMVNELRDVCRNIEHQANRLEEAELYEQADRLREMAQNLRHQARQIRSHATAPGPYQATRH